MRASLMRISWVSSATYCLSRSFWAFSRAQATGLFPAQPRVYATAYWAKEITCSMAGLTRRRQPFGSGMLGNFLCFIIAPPGLTEGDHNTFGDKELSAISHRARIGGSAHHASNHASVGLAARAAPRLVHSSLDSRAIASRSTSTSVIAIDTSRSFR